MAMRLEWDKFEVALLIDACEQVLHNRIARSEAVSTLSSVLRTRAIRNGVEIDEVFRNENGISLQMTKMIFLLTEGKTGLPGASKLYAEMVELKKENPGEYNKILQGAKEQITSEGQIKKANNREKFSQWLSDNPPRKQSKEAIIRALDESSDYCRSHSICKESFWEITDRSQFTAISSKLQGIRIFRLTHRKTALVLDNATQAYKEFLKNQEEMSIQIEDISKIPTVTDEVETGNNVNGNKNPIELSFSKDDSIEIMQMKLDRVTSILHQRYSLQPATSVTEVMKSNEDLPIPHIHVWTKRIKDQTAAQYLLAQGIIRPLDVRSEEEKRNDRFASLEKATSLLVSRYANRPASSLGEITKQNPDVSFGSFNAWTREFYRKTASEYLRDKGILIVYEIDPEKQREEKRNERLARLDEVTSLLVSRYAGKPASGLGELAKQNPEVSVSNINLWTKEFYEKTASEYLRDKGILLPTTEKTAVQKLQESIAQIKESLGGGQIRKLSEIDSCNLGISLMTLSNWVKAVHGKSLSEFLIDEGILASEAPNKQNASQISSSASSASDNGYVEEESLDDDPINEIELSLFRTIEYLKTRYDAVLQENHISNNEREMVYKIKNYNRDIMWVRYTHSEISQDICIETEPEYIEAIDHQLNGFIEIQYRKAHPRQRLFFEDYGSIRKTLVSICDSIDNYFEDTETDQAQYDREKHSQEPYSISKVYVESNNNNCSLIDTETSEKPVTAHSQAQNATIDLTPYKTILEEHFPKGYRLESALDMKRMRRYYEALTGKELDIDQAKLESVLKNCCIVYDGRLYMPQTMLSEEMKVKILSFIDRCFEEGRSSVYYEAIFKEFSEDLLDHNIFNSDMLKAYLMHYVSGRYYIGRSYLSAELCAEVDPIEEVRQRLMQYDSPVQVDELCDSLSHIPGDRVRFILASNGEFVRNSKGEYFHASSLDLTEEELENIAAIIDAAVEEHEFISGNELYNAIQTKYPYTYEKNAVFSVIGWRDALKYKFGDRFSFVGNIVSEAGSSLSMSDVFAEYGKGRQRFSLDELDQFADSIGTTIYFDSLYTNAIRISHKWFASKESARFSVQETDAVLDRFCGGSYIPLSAVSEFAVFPEASFPWTEYLLEQYVAFFSEKFYLMHGNYNKNCAVGAIVRKTCQFSSFDELVTDILAKSDISLQKKEVLDYLAEKGFIARRSYTNIEALLINARAMRNQKEK